MNPAVAAILLPSLTRLAVSVTGTTGPPDVRERLRLAEAGQLGLSDATALGVQIDDLAGLLARNLTFSAGNYNLAREICSSRMRRRDHLDRHHEAGRRGDLRHDRSRRLHRLPVRLWLGEDGDHPGDDHPRQVLVQGAAVAVAEHCPPHEPDSVVRGVARVYRERKARGGCHGARLSLACDIPGLSGPFRRDRVARPATHASLPSIMAMGPVCHRLGNMPATGVDRSRLLRVNVIMTNRAPLAATLIVLAAATLAGCGSSAPSYPHAWCGPLITAFHAKETRQAYLNGLVAAGKQGAPVAQLVEDETAYTQDEADANGTGSDSFAALADAPKVLARVTADLKALNAECGQAVGAYKSDNA